MRSQTVSRPRRYRKCADGIDSLIEDTLEEILNGLETVHSFSGHRDELDNMIE